LSKFKIYPKSLADKLSCPYTDLLPELKEAEKNGHEFIELGNGMIESALWFAVAYANEMRKYLSEINNSEISQKYALALANLHCLAYSEEYSSSVAFALLNEHVAKRVGIKEYDNVGIFMTGNGFYSCVKSFFDFIGINDRI
jgi:hypothetical protein